MEQAGDQGDQRKGGGLPGKRALAKPRDEEYVALTFPQRLMEVLEEESYSEVVSWLSHGQAFMIHQEYPFTQDIMPRHFNKSSKFSSFNRKLTRWGFVRINRGPDLGAIYHPLFQKGQHKLLSRMSCQSGKTSSIPNSPLQRDYYRQTGRVVDEDGSTTRIPANTNDSSTAPSERTSRDVPTSAAATPSVPVQQQQNDTHTAAQALGGLSQTLERLSSATQLQLLQQLQNEQQMHQSMSTQLQEALKFQQMQNLIHSLSQHQQRQQEAQLRLHVLAQIQARQQLNQFLSTELGRANLTSYRATTTLPEANNVPQATNLEHLLALQQLQQSTAPLLRPLAAREAHLRDQEAQLNEDSDGDKKPASSSKRRKS